MGAAVKVVAGAGLIAAGFLIPGAQGLIIPGLKLSIGAAAIAIGASVALGGIAQAIQKPHSGSLLNDPSGRLATIRQAAAPKRVIYGQCRVGGILSFANHAGLRIAPTDQNQLVITVAGHAIDSYQAVYFNDESPEVDLTSGLGLGNWFGHVFLQFKNGYDGDVSFPSLISDSQGIWTADHRQRGCAGVYARLNFEEALYPNGVPNITFLVRGKLVFDPRINSPLAVASVAGGTAAESEGTWGIDLVDSDTFDLQGTGMSVTTTGAHGFAGGEVVRIRSGQVFELGYSNNAALVIADYLLDPWVGMGVPYAKVKSSVLIAAANVCDENITLPDASTEDRYTINGTFETSEQHGEILAQMANAMAGHVTYIGGEWHIIPGAFRLPVMELTDADVVAPMQVQLKRSKRDLVNGIKGTFPSASHNYIETDFPALTGDTYLSEDQGVRVWKDIFLPFTTTATACQRIAGIELERNRRQVSIQMTCSMGAYELQPGDVVEFTHSRYSWALETFEVAECGLGQNEDGAMVVTLQLVQTDVDVYGFAVDDYGNLIDPDLINLLSRTIPFGWSPGMEHRPDATTLGAPSFRARADYNFGLTQQYNVKADGSMEAQLRIAGFLPTNLFSEQISRPRTKNLVATTASTGGFLAGGFRYYIAVTALDQVVSGSPPVEDLGRLTALSEIAVVNVPAGTNTNTVTLHDLRWDTGTAGWFLLFGTDKFRLSSQAGASYLGSLGSAVTVTGPQTQPTSITFKGLNVPLQLPDGYFEHLRGAPDHRFEHLRIRATRGIHLGIWGGQVVSTGGTGSPPGAPWTITVNVTPPFTTNVMAGRYVMLVGLMDQPLEYAADSGMPLAEFLIDSNDGTTLTLATGQANPADHGFIPGAVVVICTKATSVGSDANGNYIEDTGFGQGGQDLGDQDPNIGGGDDSLTGKIIRFISGTGTANTALIAGNNVAAKKIYIVGEWPVTPDTTSVFVILDPQAMLDHETDLLATEKIDSFVSLKIDAGNLPSDQYFIQIFTVSPQGKESIETTSPHRFIYLFGSADPGILITEDTVLEVYHRNIRVDCSQASPPVAIQLTILDASILPGRDTTITKIDALPLDVTIVTPGGHTNSFGSSKVLSNQWDTTTIRAYEDA